MDEEKVYFGKLEYHKWDKAAQELINAFDDNGIRYYLSYKMYGTGCEVRVPGMCSEELKELYDKFVNAHLAVEDWARERR